jgi:mannose-6-phosphate isomerase-like protein (cupin superfamily)
MSEISLEPGEIFEHIHSVPSTTMLVRGDMSLEIGGVVTKLKINEPVAVEAGVSHSLINSGRDPGTVRCYYNPAEPPPSI